MKQIKNTTQQTEVIEENHTKEFDEFFIKDEDGYILQIYLSDNVQKSK